MLGYLGLMKTDERCTNFKNILDRRSFDFDRDNNDESL